MTLTTAQEISLFQILNAIYADSYHIMSAMGSLSASRNTGLPGQTSVISSVRTWIAGLSDDTGVVLISLINQWDDIGLNVGVMENGGAGNTTGISFNWDSKRALIKERVKMLVTFYHKDETEARENKSGGADSCFIPIIR